MTFTCHCPFQTVSGLSGPPPPASPALANHRATGPTVASISATSCRVASSSVTSSGRAMTGAAKPDGASRSVAMTAAAPDETRPRTSAPPIPPPAPVTTATRPAGSMGAKLASGKVSVYARQGKVVTMAAELRTDYHRGLEAINRLLTQMIASVEDAISAASTALLSSDDEAAEHVVLRGQIIEDLHQSVEALVFTQLARQAPVGGDLRYLVAALRIVPELELTRGLA